MNRNMARLLADKVMYLKICSLSLTGFPTLNYIKVTFLGQHMTIQQNGKPRLAHVIFLFHVIQLL